MDTLWNAILSSLPALIFVILAAIILYGQVRALNASIHNLEMRIDNFQAKVDEKLDFINDRFIRIETTINQIHAQSESTQDFIEMVKQMLFDDIV